MESIVSVACMIWEVGLKGKIKGKCSVSASWFASGTLAGGKGFGIEVI